MRKLLAILLMVAILVLLSPALVSAKPITPQILEAVFIHYEHPGKGRPSPAPPETKVYDYYLLLGPQWDLSKYSGGVPYVINPSGAPLGAEAEVKAGFEVWDAATSAELFNDNPLIDADAWWGKLDGRNNVSWQVIAGGGIIAGTWVWYLDNDGNEKMSEGDELIETDIVFNASQRWGVDPDGEGGTYKIKLYDVRNIATHEVGHVVGLDDLYEAKYSDITMYGYSTKGETKKISLEIGDVNGTRSLYGE